MKYILSILVLFFVVGVSAQTDEDLKAHYSFDDCTAMELTLNGPNGTIIGSPNCVCGATGMAFDLNGTTDHILFIGILNDYLRKDNFTLSFFFSPSNTVGTQTIFSKKEACDDVNAFAVRFTPQSQKLTVELSENSSKKSILETNIDQGKCWQHVTIVRSAGDSYLYLNGTLRDEDEVSSRID